MIYVNKVFFVALLAGVIVGLPLAFYVGWWAHK